MKGKEVSCRSSMLVCLSLALFLQTFFYPLKELRQNDGAIYCFRKFFCTRKKERTVRWSDDRSMFDAWWACFGGKRDGRLQKKGGGMLAGLAGKEIGDRESQRTPFGPPSTFHLR